MFHFPPHFFNRRPRSTKAQRKDRRVRLHLEELENRLAPAAMNIVVNTTADDPNGPVAGQTTLRDAITQANQAGNAGSTISFAAGLSGTIQLQKALPAIGQNMTVQGPGFSTLDVSGGWFTKNAFTVFDINAGVTAEIDGLTIENGYVAGANGGGIYNSGTLTLKNDFVYDNQAVVAGTAGGNGGGIFNASGATLKISGTDFGMNSADSNSGWGGAIYNFGTLTCSTTEIYSNTAYNGGGIANVGTESSSSFDTTEIQSNVADNLGGGIYENGGTVGMSGSTSAVIRANDAVNGGGVYVNSGTLTLTFGVEVNGNKATTGSGGGIYIAGGKVTLSGGTIYNNTAT